MRCARPIPVALVAAATILAGGALAQHQGHAPLAAQGASPDGRVLVALPAPMVEHTLANMRDHLLALQEIQEHLAQSRFDAAARLAETRLGMSSLETHGAHEVGRYMPEGMRGAGVAMHRAASRFALVATDAGVDGDVRPALGALAAVTSTCVACHAAYRFK